MSSFVPAPDAKPPYFADPEEGQAHPDLPDGFSNEPEASEDEAPAEAVEPEAESEPDNGGDADAAPSGKADGSDS